MRDQQTTYRNVAITKKTWYDYGNPYNWPDYLASTTSYTGTYLSRFKGRSDIVQGDGNFPTVYRAYDVTCDADSQSESYNSGWIWRYNSPPHVPVAGRCWRRTRTEYAGSGYIASSYTLHGLSSTGYPVVPTLVLNEARTKALNQLVSSDLNFGQSLGEMRDTVGLLNATILKVVRAYRAARRGDHRTLTNMFGKPQSGKKTFGNAWLAYQFGWKPLVNDIYNFVEAIGDARDKSDDITVTQVVEKEQGFPFFTTYSYTGTSVAGCQVSYTYKLLDSEKAALNTLGLRNPLSLAWELLPSSYIVDWFLSVGGVLSALNADLGYEFHHGYETQFRKGDFRISSSSFPGSNTYSWDVKSFAMSRTVVGVPPKPGLYIKSGLNLGQVLTSLALINSRA